MLGAIVLPLIVGVSSPAAPPRAGPESSLYTDGDGIVWSHQTNRHGAVLRSGRNILYLGRDCDARSPRFGGGRWGWANGGVLVTFARRRIGFPRQDPPVPAVRCDL